jgi:hypothetical protein
MPEAINSRKYLFFRRLFKFDMMWRCQTSTHINININSTSIKQANREEDSDANQFAPH